MSIKKDKSKIQGQARTPSVCAVVPYQPKGQTLSDPVCMGCGQMYPNGVRKRKVSKTSVYTRSSNRLWRPNGYLPPRIKLP